MHIPPRLQPFLMAVVACVGLASVVAVDLVRERGLAIRSAGTDTANLARLLEEPVRQILRRVERRLDTASRQVMQVDREARAGNPALRQRLQSLLPADGLLRSIELVDPNGVVLVSTRPDVAGKGNAPTARSASAPGPAAQPRSGIGAPEMGRDGRWSLPVVQLIAGPDGHIDGMLTAIVDPAYFQSLLDAVDTRSNGFVTLFHAQGWIVATSPANATLFARHWRDTPMFRDHLPRSPTHTVQQVVVRDGTERVYSYRALKDYPVVVSIGVSLTDALAEWRDHVVWNGVLVGLMFVVLMGAATAMARHQARRETAERTLVESAEQMRAIVGGVADGIVTINHHGQIESVNRAGEAIFGCASEGLLKRQARALLADPPEPETAADWFAAALRKAAGERTEATGRRSDGSEFPIEVSITRINRSGHPLYIAVVRDITQRKRFETELQVQRTELQVMNRELEDFAFLSSHDLQEPLRKIRGFAQLLRQRIGGTLEERSNSYIDYIEEASGRLQALIRDLLDYSRTSRGQLTLVPVDLKQLALTVASELSPAIAEAQARVEVREMPVVQADATQMRLLLQNLLSNALKFRGTQPPVITLWAEAEADADESTCHLHVRDNGIGIDPKYHAAIFHSLKRLHTREQYAGTGLGLAICTRVAERHGGRLGVTSTPGQGSVFTLSLPMHAQSAAAQADSLAKEAP